MQNKGKPDRVLDNELSKTVDRFRQEGLKVSLTYMFFGILWILLSERLIYTLIDNEEIRHIASTYKGLLFIIFTSLLLYLLVGHQIKKIETSRNRIMELSYYDALTGLHNRRYYEEQIGTLDIEKNLPISIIMADIDGLKLANDTFGHRVGDELIKKSAIALKKSCRTNDLIARWGGDEFVVVLPNTKEEEVSKIVQRIKDTCSQDHVEMVRVSMSLGWDTKKAVGEDILTVLNNAEDHMYQNKATRSQSLRDDIVKSILQEIRSRYPEIEKAECINEIIEEVNRKLTIS